MQALGELEEIRFVVHGQKGFNPDHKRVFAILSKSGLPMGVDIVFSSPGSKDQNLRRDESAAALGCAVVPRDSDSPRRFGSAEKLCDSESASYPGLGPKRGKLEEES